MNDDDDLGPAYSLPPDDSHPGDIAARVMTYPEQKHLVENDITFGWLMRIEPKFKGNRTELGSVHETAHMAQGAFKDLFEQLLVGMLGHLPKFVVVINAPWWEQANAHEREALVFHELMHVRQKMDKYGGLKFDKDGRPVYGCQGHDIEEFRAVVQRYGAWKGDIADFLQAARDA